MRRVKGAKVSSLVKGMFYNFSIDRTDQEILAYLIRVYNYILFNEQDDLDAFVDEGENKKQIEGLFLLLFCRQN